MIQVRYCTVGAREISTYLAQEKYLHKKGIMYHIPPSLLSVGRAEYQACVIQVQYTWVPASRNHDAFVNKVTPLILQYISQFLDFQMLITLFIVHIIGHKELSIEEKTRVIIM